MARITRKRVLDEVTKFYLASPDFNGIPIQGLLDRLGCKEGALYRILRGLISSDLVGIVFSEREVNPHILRHGFEATGTQLQALGGRLDPRHACAYPRTAHLETTVDQSKYSSQPYRLRLALGDPQLSFRSFDLSVLEAYRNDPRYYYSNDDVTGSICIRDEHFESSAMPEGDKVLLESFGFSYDDSLNRAVAVFLRYLADLSEEHQQIWRAKELLDTYQLHPDYFRMTIEGAFVRHVPICTAILLEQHTINQMCKAMRRPPLFRQDFGRYAEEPPKNFGFLIRPTLQEFNGFVLILDKLMSDNISKKFFGEEVADATEVTDGQGRTFSQQKGTITMLDEWVRASYSTDDWAQWGAVIQAFRNVRQLRQRPAHCLEEDSFDHKYLADQRDLLVKAYGAVRTIRLLFAEHPDVAPARIDVPDSLRNGLIRLY